MNNLTDSWQIPNNIRYYVTTRNHGLSIPPFATNNLATHVGDDLHTVLMNRQALRAELNLINEPHWLQQIHSNRCVIIEQDTNREADATITTTTQQALVIMTADCLPILLCNQHGTEIAAIHAGWRGLLNGIIENTVAKLRSRAQDTLAWIGPGICKTCFAIKQDVVDAYLAKYAFSIDNFRNTHNQGVWHADLAGIAEKILNTVNINNVYKSNVCTFEQQNDFYSYRRDGETGRMATLIWIEHE